MDNNNNISLSKASNTKSFIKGIINANDTNGEHMERIREMVKKYTQISKKHNDDENNTYLIKLKTNIAQIVLTLRDEIGIDFSVDEDPTKIWEEFLDENELENLRGQQLYDKLLENTMLLVVKTCKEQVSSYRDMDAKFEQIFAKMEKVKTKYKVQKSNLNSYDDELCKVIRNDRRRLLYVTKLIKEAEDQEKSERVQRLQNAMKEKKAIERIKAVQSKLVKEKETLNIQQEKLNEKEIELKKKEDQ